MEYDELLKRADDMNALECRTTPQMASEIIEEQSAAIRDLTAKLDGYKGFLEGHTAVIKQVESEKAELQAKLDSVRPRPIEEAPKDRRCANERLIYAIHPKEKTLCRAYFDPDSYSKKPRPYFSYLGQRTTDSREHQPTHFVSIAAISALTSLENDNADD